MKTYKLKNIITGEIEGAATCHDIFDAKKILEMSVKNIYHPYIIYREGA